jgi:hypothetical protein
MYGSCDVLPEVDDAARRTRDFGEAITASIATRSPCVSQLHVSAELASYNRRASVMIFSAPTLGIGPDDEPEHDIVEICPSRLGSSRPLGHDATACGQWHRGASD